MNYTNIRKLCILLALLPGAVYGAPATPDAMQSQVQTHLRLEIDKDTDTVHFIETNNDPDVITKTYILKHADPYELRPYLRRALLSRRVNSSDVKVEAVKYNDGTGVLIVSAEDYKFDKAVQGGGMTIDDIVAKLDLPQITSSSGKGEFIYFPKYDPANDLAQMLRNVGMNVPFDVQENTYGQDFAYVDHEINAIYFFVTSWSVKYIRHLLQLYDQPYPEVQVVYKIYEIDKENDDKIGADWQAWKNGPGRDLFAAASRYSSGWDFSQNIPGMPWVNNSHTQFVKFSPRWNTRFLDLISAKGDAKVLTSGVLNLVNQMEGHIDARTQYPGYVPGNSNDSIILNTEARFDNSTLAAIPAGFQITDAMGNIFQVTGAIDKEGRGISIRNGAPNQNLIIVRTLTGPEYVYFMKLDPVAASPSGTMFMGNTEALGYEVQCTNVTITPIPIVAGTPPAPVPWDTSQQYIIQKDAPRRTAVHTLTSGNDPFGFHMSMIPSICGQATTLSINAYNTSLIGFENNGTPRTERSEINTKVMVANNGSTFVIGGIENRSSIHSVSNFICIGSIYRLGWLLGTEGETGKLSRLVTVLQCTPVRLDVSLPQHASEDFRKIDGSVKKAGVKNNKLGFDQFLIDKDKKVPDTLP